LCRPGHSGPYCNLCSDGYSQDPFMLCQKCSSRTADFIWTIVAALCVICAIVGLNIVLKKKLRRSGKGAFIWKKTKNGIKVLFASGQITAALPRVVPAITLPENFQKAIAASNILNLNPFDLVPLGCFADGFTLYIQLVILTVPVIFVCALLVAKGYQQNEKAFFNGALAITYLTLPTITTTTFNIFPCDSFDNGWVKVSILLAKVKNPASFS
jgi:hypothetical protein